jgi:hypothetical protein
LLLQNASLRAGAEVEKVATSTCHLHFVSGLICCLLAGGVTGAAEAASTRCLQAGAELEEIAASTRRLDEAGVELKVVAVSTRLNEAGAELDKAAASTRLDEAGVELEKDAALTCLEAGRSQGWSGTRCCFSRPPGIDYYSHKPTTQPRKKHHHQHGEKSN